MAFFSATSFIISYSLFTLCPVNAEINKNGIEKIVELDLNADEKAKFAASAAAVHKTNAALKEVGAL